MSERSKKLLHAGFYLLVFAFLYLWFSKIHAVVVFDGDDWSYLAYVRKTTPVWGEWNPSKVFPEVIFPFFSTLAAFVLTPLTGDYITAQTIMHAFVISAFITGYLWCFSCLLRRSFPLSRLSAALMMLLFLLFHFLALRSSETDNPYMLYCVDLNCYYNYLLPSLLNSALVMCLLNNPRLDSFLAGGSFVLRGCFYLVVYLAIFSNLPSSGILTAYAGSVLLLYMIRCWKARNWKHFLRDNAFPVGILTAFVISAVFELSGGRAAVASDGSSIIFRIVHSCKNLLGMVLNCNRVFLLCLFVILVAAGIVLITGKTNRKTSNCPVGLCGVLLVSIAAYGAYLVLICAAVNPGSIRRSEYLFGLFFYVTFFAILALGFLLSRYPKILMILPLLVFFLASEADTREKTFLESNFANAHPSVCADISRSLIVQLQEADRSGLSQTELRVPMYVSDPENTDNWPHSYFLMHRIPGTLYAHGLTTRHIDIIPVADPAMNEWFHLPLPRK